VRMNAKDYVEGGLDIEDAEVLAPLLERVGISALSITSGTMCEGDCVEPREAVDAVYEGFEVGRTL
jgi:hypothetical protein